ncbi:MAG TPA: hypothetical protein V6D11_11350 [Waterburya sp.]|jgi:hypothetical protein
MTFSTSAHPLPFYADGETPLEELVDKFGSRLEGLASYEKLILLATIATNLAFHDTDETQEDWGHLDTYQELPSTTVTDELTDAFPSLDTLSRDALLGLCEGLVAQLRYTREVD